MPLEKFASQWGLSELQLALGFIGLLFLVWVIVYNIRNAKSRKGDEDLRIEPSSEPAEPIVEEPIVVSPNLYQTPLVQAIDPRIDCVIALRFSEPISGIEILEALREWSDLQIPWMAWPSPHKFW
jgi:hypothetical protein